MYSKDTLKKAS